MADHSFAAAFFEASVWHGSLERAEAIVAAHPEVASSDIHTAAILGDDGAIRRFLAVNARNATAKGGPLGWDALTHLCFSRYLRLDRTRSDNRMTRWGYTALHQAVRRDNTLAIVELFLDHGADPTLVTRRLPWNQGGGKSAIALAARRGRGDVLALLERRGIPLELHGVERLIAACARNDP